MLTSQWFPIWTSNLSLIRWVQTCARRINHFRKFWIDGHCIAHICAWLWNGQICIIHQCWIHEHKSLWHMSSTQNTILLQEHCTICPMLHGRSLGLPRYQHQGYIYIYSERTWNINQARDKEILLMHSSPQKTFQEHAAWSCHRSLPTGNNLTQILNISYKGHKCMLKSRTQFWQVAHQLWHHKIPKHTTTFGLRVKDNEHDSQACCCGYICLRMERQLWAHIY